MRNLFIILCIFIFPQALLAHSGRTNAEGCHNDRIHGGYHCHNGGSRPEPRRTAQPVYIPQVTVPKPQPIYTAVSPESVLPKPIEGTAQVLDGDTIQIGTTRIRLFGIDAFEGEQTCTSENGKEYGCGGIATRTLSEQIEGKEVSCAARGTDAYKRKLAVCRVESIDLASLLVRNGYALAYTKYALDYVSDEKFAKEQLAGAHSGTFVKPWEYRLTRKSAGAEAQRLSTPPSEDCAIKGNVRTDGTRIYHVPDDPYYESVKPENWFCSIGEAERAGFRHAGGK